MTRRTKRAGFTLIEILVVVAILAILATLVVPNIMDSPDRARQASVKHDINSISSALAIYRLDHANYPNSLQDLSSGSRKYLKEVPLDPWNNPYQYEKGGHRSGGKYKFDLFSYGADGVEGGSDVDADIGNWNLRN
ncbi:MAG: type II secretion system major pseudopilin GspG [Candidatus Oxydemutatoraceae bacterium WSBS_2016_MAG_OTU14]